MSPGECVVGGGGGGGGQEEARRSTGLYEKKGGGKAKEIPSCPWEEEEEDCRGHVGHFKPDPTLRIYSIY